MTKTNPAHLSTTSISALSLNSPEQVVLRRGPLRAHTKDTIETAPVAKPLFKPSKPNLLPEMRMINASNHFYKVGDTQLQLHTKELEQEQQQIEELCRTNIKKMEEAAKRSQAEGVWSYLQKIGSSILSAISIYLGFATMATATLVGGALVAAGIMTLANLVLTEVGFWDWVVEKMAGDNEDQRKRYRELVTIAGLSVIGAQLFALGSLAVFGTFTLATIAVPVAQLAFTIASTMSSVTGQISEARTAWSQAELTELQGKLAISQREVEKLTDRIETTLTSQQQTFRSAKHMLDLAIEARRQAIYEI